MKPNNVQRIKHPPGDPASPSYSHFLPTIFSPIDRILASLVESLLNARRRSTCRSLAHWRYAVQVCRSCVRAGSLPIHVYLVARRVDQVNRVHHTDVLGLLELLEFHVVPYSVVGNRTFWFIAHHTSEFAAAIRHCRRHCSEIFRAIASTLYNATQTIVLVIDLIVVECVCPDVLRKVDFSKAAVAVIENLTQIVVTASPFALDRARASVDNLAV